MVVSGHEPEGRVVDHAGRMLRMAKGMIQVCVLPGGVLPCVARHAWQVVPDPDKKREANATVCMQVVEALGARWAFAGEPLQVRIGIHTGARCLWTRNRCPCSSLRQAARWHV